MIILQNRQLAAILFRKLLNDNNEEYRKLDESSQQYCKTELLTSLQNEESEVVRKKVCDAVAELARLYVGQYNLTSNFLMSVLLKFNNLNSTSYTW